MMVLIKTFQSFRKFTFIIIKICHYKNKKIQYIDYAPGAQFITINSEAFSFYKNILV